MGGLAQPGQQQGLKPTPIAGSGHRSPPFSKWFSSFLREELKPYPGRLNLVLRYTVAATLTMLAIVTFRLPGAAVGGFFSLLVPRDSPTTTLRGGVSTLVAFLAGLAFVLLGAILLINYPLTHFLWAIVSFFVAFYGISAISNYGAATAFAIVIVLLVPLWDENLPQSALVLASLWTAGAVALAIFVTIVVEFAFSFFQTKDELIEGLSERLKAIRTLLEQSARQAEGPPGKSKLSQLAMVGVSRLRQLALADRSPEPGPARISTTVSLVGRLVDILAAFQRYETLTPKDASRLQALADQTGRLQQQLKAGKREQTLPPLKSTSEGPLILLSLEQIIELLRQSFCPEPGQAFTLDSVTPALPSILKPDSFSNPEHLHFALRGCLASLLCYFILNAVFWPGLSTSLFTCVVTALTSIGSSRQKQLLRTSGAIMGGLFLGIGSQVLILPMLDTVVGFTGMFATVTFIAAWFITASPRLSYFGTQLALAFYLIQLRSPFPQTDLAIARDNLMGILLGLVMMWLIFETLGSKPAVQVMRELFADNLRAMAQLSRPWTQGKLVDLQKIRTLRDKIGQNFAAVNSQADAVLFEVGHGRHRSLAERERLLGWQPQLRSLFLLEIALLQYRLQISPRDVPATVLRASARFDDEIGALLEELAEAFTPGNKSWRRFDVRSAYCDFEQAVQTAYGDQITVRSRAVLAIASQMIDLASRLLAEMTEAGRDVRQSMSESI